MKRLLLLFLIPIQSGGQDITGVWTGTMVTAGQELPYELVISRNEDRLEGYSLTVFSVNGDQNTGLKSVKIKSKKDKVTIEDGELVQDNYTTPAKRVMVFSILTVSRQDTILTLSGSFTSRAFNNPGYKGYIFLKKRKNFSRSLLVAKLQQLDLLGNLSFMNPGQVKEEVELSSTTSDKDRDPVKGNQFTMMPPGENDSIMKPAWISAGLAKRKIETVQYISFFSDSLILSLYDNGQVDGDTVSVVLNGSKIMEKIALTTHATSHVLHILPQMGDTLRIVMYAENLGLIPPNTGLLVIQDGPARFEVRFSGDLQKNAAIVLSRMRGLQPR